MRLVRAEKKLSQREAAETIGITQREWQGMEEGRAARRIDVKVAKIALAFGVDRDWLMWGGPLVDPNPETPDDLTGGSEGVNSTESWSTTPENVVAISFPRAA